MYKPYFKYPDNKAKDFVIEKLDSYGVTKDKIVEASMERQKGYMPEYNKSDFGISFDKLMSKRNVLNNCMVGIYLDEQASKGDMPEPLLEIMRADAGVFELDEVLGIDIARDYGSTGVTNFGLLDCQKIPLVKQLDEDPNRICVFIDDLVSALIAGVCACTMHRYYEEYVYI